MSDFKDPYPGTSQERDIEARSKSGMVPTPANQTLAHCCECNRLELTESYRRMQLDQNERVVVDAAAAIICNASGTATCREAADAFLTAYFKKHTVVDERFRL